MGEAPGVVVCDLDGVVYLGEKAVPGAGDALAALATAGFDLLFCTNNSSRTLAETAAKVAEVTGFPARADQVVSSATAAATLVEAGTPALVVGGAGVREALTIAGAEVVNDWEEAQVVVAGLDVELTYRRLAAATRAIRAGARLIATNHDPTFPTAEGLLPGAGAIVAALETAGGTQAVVAGKPHAPMRRLIAERVAGRSAWVVGDRPDTDLAMAVAEGWASVLVLTGVTDDAGTVDPPPDLVLDSIAQLPPRLRR